MSQDAGLKRELGLFEVTLSGVGIILGAGIYALIGKAAGLAGNSVWISFAIAALIAVFSGLSYAELSSIFPKASAEYEYTSQAFGLRPAMIIGWLIIFSGVTGSAAVALGFGGYFSALFGVSVLSSALVLIVLLSIILFYGIKTSAWLAIAFTLIEMAGLIIIIYIGIPHLGSVDYLEMPHSFKGIFEAAALIFFAYMGFEEMVKLSEETKNPEKTIPRALIIALIITIVLYMLVAVSAVSVMGWEGLSESDAPFADIAFAAMGEDAFVVISVIALFATANTVLLMMLAASRMIYGMACSFSLPRTLAKVHPARKTPWVAILMITILSMVLVFTRDIAFVANINNFILFLTFAVINSALIYLRYKEPQLPRPFKVPFSIGRLPLLPLMGILTCAFLMLQLDWKVMMAGMVLVLVSGLISMVGIRTR